MASWRREQLLDARIGFKEVWADELLEHPDVAHAARALIDAGCDPRLAYRILRE